MLPALRLRSGRTAAWYSTIACSGFPRCVRKTRTPTEIKNHCSCLLRSPSARGSNEIAGDRKSLLRTLRIGKAGMFVKSRIPERLLCQPDAYGDAREAE